MTTPPPGRDATAEFTYLGYRIAVHDGRWITLTDSEDDIEFSDVCAHCGARQGLEEWPPVVIEAEEGGDTALFSFCDERCKRAWSK